jgi:pantothenate synthetase
VRVHEQCDVVVVSIFVNPAVQQSRGLREVPRDVAADRAVLEHVGVGVLFPEAARCTRRRGDDSARRRLDHLAGRRRGPLDGMATIVAALTTWSRVAVFGEKGGSSCGSCAGWCARSARRQRADDAKATGWR